MCVFVYLRHMSCSSIWPRTRCVAKGFELLLLLPWVLGPQGYATKCSLRDPRYETPGFTPVRQGCYRLTYSTGPEWLNRLFFSNSGTMTQGYHMLDGCPTTELHVAMLFTEVQHSCTHLYMYVWVFTSKTRSWFGLKLRITFLPRYINA